MSKPRGAAANVLPHRAEACEDKYNEEIDELSTDFGVNYNCSRAAWYLYYKTREGMVIHDYHALPARTIWYSSDHPKTKLRDEVRCDAVIVGFDKHKNSIILAPDAIDLHYIDTGDLDNAENLALVILAMVRYARALEAEREEAKQKKNG